MPAYIVASCFFIGCLPFSGFEPSTHFFPGTLLYETRGAGADALCLFAVAMQEYDVEVVAFILERGVVVGLALDSDRTKRCSHGEMYTDAGLCHVQVMTLPADAVPFVASLSRRTVKAKMSALVCSIQTIYRPPVRLEIDMQN